MRRITQVAVALAALLLVQALNGCQKEEAGNRQAETTTAIQASTPRYLAATGGKLYVSCYNPPSVVRLDTTTLQVEAICRLGNYQPEGMAIVGSRLFVASTWIQDEAGNAMYDNKVYVIDLGSFTVETTVEVGLNPQTVLSVDDRTVVVNSTGNYSSVPGSTTFIDVPTLTTTDAGVPLTGMATRSGMVYGYNAPYGSSAVSFLALDPTTLQTTPLLTSAAIRNPYGITAADSSLYICTGVYNANGDVARYRLDGTRLWKQEAGVFTSKVVPLGDGTAYVLNQGTWGSSNASLDRINLATGEIDRSIFASVNGRGLGDVAQDALVYGSKAYVTVSFSNTVETITITNNRSVQIAL
ncbi:MAG: hypothetical protein IJU19_06315 [Bacteroidales bacterium]|nr:hypothetical protein [Bacteroidales bacterium]